MLTGWDRREVDSIHAAGIHEEYEGVNRKGDLLPQAMDEARRRASSAKAAMEVSECHRLSPLSLSLYPGLL